MSEWKEITDEEAAQWVFDNARQIPEGGSMNNWQAVGQEFMDAAQEAMDEDAFQEFLRKKAFPAPLVDEDEGSFPPFPDWIEEIAVDPNGDIYGYEGGCFFEHIRWAPVDDYDGLRYARIGKINAPVGIEKSKTMHFRLVDEPAGVPYDHPSHMDAGQPGEAEPLPQLPDLSALPLSRVEPLPSRFGPNDFLYVEDAPDQQID